MLYAMQVLANQLSTHAAPPGISATASTAFHVADIVTALSYFAIAATLLVLVVRLRHELPFPIVFVLFGAFIVLCGATHIMGVLPLGASRGTIETATMVATAAVSLLTASLLPFFVPRVSALVRDAKLAREVERAQAREAALAESNEVLLSQSQQLTLTNERLADSLRERQLLEVHLHQVQKMELMGRLASGVAHDFNNLLTVIQGNVDLMRTEIADDAAVVSHLEEIGLATEHATELTRRLLAFSRKERGTTQRTTLDALVAKELRLLQRALPSEMRLTVRASVAEGFVQVDVNQMQQAILNLIVNARDATASAGRGNGTVTIETGAVVVAPESAPTSPPVGPGVYMTVAVRDEGTGISDEVRSKIFEPFFTTKEEGKGTGLGLSMIYDVMVQSGGGVQVETAVGSGTTVTLLLPRVA